MENKIKSFFKNLENEDDINIILDDLLADDWEPSLSQFTNLYLNHLFLDAELKFPVSFLQHWQDDIGIIVFYGTDAHSKSNSSIVNSILQFWLEKEYPVIKGKQVFINSFLLQNIRGRKIIASIPHPENGDWCLLLEGGIVLPLTQYQSIESTKLNSGYVGKWTIGEVEEIILNPIYSYGFWYKDIDLFIEWKYTFLYTLAILKIESYDLNIFDNLYRSFCRFISKNICSHKNIDNPIRDKDIFLKITIQTIRNIESFITGKEEAAISKNLIYLLNNRYAYLPKMYKLISNYYPNEILNLLTPKNFDIYKWNDLISNLNVKDSHLKGVSLENVANYFISTINGLMITGVRQRLEREEIDIICCNTSLDSDLWRLGSLILVECKNINKKLEVSDIRNLVPIMDSKGIQTTLLFTQQGLTSVAKKEILHQFFSGKTIISFDIEDITRVNDTNNHPYNLVIQKLNDLENKFEDDLRLLY